MYYYQQIFKKFFHLLTLKYFHNGFSIIYMCYKFENNSRGTNSILVLNISVTIFSKNS